MVVLTAMLLHLILFASVACTYTCFDFKAPITVTAPSYMPAFSVFANHFDAVQLLVDISSRVTDGTITPFTESKDVTVTITIDASFGTEEINPKASQDVQIQTHGVGSGKPYWDLGGQTAGIITSVPLKRLDTPPCIGPVQARVHRMRYGSLDCMLMRVHTPR